MRTSFTLSLMATALVLGLTACQSGSQPSKPSEPKAPSVAVPVSAPTAPIMTPPPAAAPAAAPEVQPSPTPGMMQSMTGSTGVPTPQIVGEPASQAAAFDEGLAQAQQDADISKAGEQMQATTRDYFDASTKFDTGRTTNTVNN
jgi:hypothetical protein